MKELIEKLLKNHKLKLENSWSETLKLKSSAMKHLSEDQSVCDIDCKFLQLLCWEEKPRSIFEIGTWVGASAYAMALATKGVGAEINTCDSLSSFWPDGDPYNKRIHFHQGHSSVILENLDIRNIDFVFNDAFLDKRTCELILDKTADEFLFCTHDFYNYGTPNKGLEAFNLMVESIKARNLEFETFTPEASWSYADGGYMGVNACIAVIKVKK